MTSFRKKAAVVCVGLFVFLATGFSACEPSYEQAVTGPALFSGNIDVNLVYGSNPKVKITDESDPKDTTRLGAYWCLPVQNAAGVAFTARCDFALSSGYSQAWAVASKTSLIISGTNLRDSLDNDIGVRVKSSVTQKCRANGTVVSLGIDCAAVANTLVDQVTARKNASMNAIADRGMQCAVGSVFITVLTNGNKTYPGLNALNPAGALLCARQVFRVTVCASAPIINETCQTLPYRYE